MYNRFKEGILDNGKWKWKSHPDTNHFPFPISHFPFLVFIKLTPILHSAPAVDSVLYQCLK